MAGTKTRISDFIEAADSRVELDRDGEPVIEIIEGEYPVRPSKFYRPSPEQF